MYGSDPLGVLSWRFEQYSAGYGVSSDLLSHVVDLAHMLVGPIREVVGVRATAIAERPFPPTSRGPRSGGWRACVRGRPRGSRSLSGAGATTAAAGRATPPDR